MHNELVITGNRQRRVTLEKASFSDRNKINVIKYKKYARDSYIDGNIVELNSPMRISSNHSAYRNIDGNNIPHILLGDGGTINQISTF